MLDEIYKIREHLSIQLKLVETEETGILKRAEVSIGLINKTLVELKEYIRKCHFITQFDEITFFKEIKPSIYSKLIYFIKIFNIESKRPTGSDKSQKKYLQNEIAKIELYFSENLEFYQYFRNNMTYLDDKYFVRGRLDLRLYVNSFSYDSDPDFSTSHDYKVAKILANDLLCIYLNSELASLERKEHNNRSGQIRKSKYAWTDSKISLVELIYALQACGCINNGSVDIKEIALFMENIFDFDLGDFYRTYLEIKNRQNPPKFLDSMKAALIKKIEEQDE
ncbi:MAG: tetracycline regulation of excision, RteC [Bacteroidales bacterium]|nr:tetracycline regulation of excision, RteC [Bacteroidales bacterium]